MTALHGGGAQRPSRLALGIGFCIVSTVWGSTWIAIKIGLDSMPPFFSAGIRFVIASVILYIMVRVRGLEVPFSAAAKKTYFAIGVISFAIPFALVYWGEQYIPSSLGCIIFGAFPFCVTVLFHFFSDAEKMDAFKIVGTILGFVGVAVLFLPGLAWTGNESMLGMLAVLLATVLQAYGLIPTKKYGVGISPVVMNLVGMSFSALFLLVLGVIFERHAGFTLTPVAAGSILYLAVVGSVLAFVTYYWLLKYMEAVYLSLSSFINPIIAILLGWVILGETLGPTILSGAVLVLAGIVVTNGRPLLKKLGRGAHSEIMP